MHKAAVIEVDSLVAEVDSSLSGSSWVGIANCFAVGRVDMVAAVEEDRRCWYWLLWWWVGKAAAAG